MGISDRMKQKNAAILADTKSAQAAPDELKNDGTFLGDRIAVKPSLGTATAPGGMAVFRVQMQQHETTVKALELELSQYRDGVLTFKLDTALVVPSKWANRHVTSFDSQVFNAFKDEIIHAGGNIQPILVRPSLTLHGQYEIVFGHRRFEACKQLGLPVLAMVITITDEELFTLMDRENRLREDLSPFEQGEMWRKALDDGLFTSARHLATHIGVSHTLVNQCLAVARLPSFVLECFATPTQIQLRWAKALCDKLLADPEYVRERSVLVKDMDEKLPGPKAFKLLMGEVGLMPSLVTSPIKLNDKIVGKWSRSSDGEVLFSVKAGIVNDELFLDIQSTVTALIVGKQLSTIL